MLIAFSLLAVGAIFYVAGEYRCSARYGRIIAPPLPATMWGRLRALFRLRTSEAFVTATLIASGWLLLLLGFAVSLYLIAIYSLAGEFFV